MKKIILTGMLGSAVLLMGCTSNTSVEKGQSILGEAKESELEQKSTQTIGGLKLGEYNAEYKISEAIKGKDNEYTHMIFSVSSDDNGAESISMLIPLDNINGELYKEQLEIIKNELKISAKDIENLKKAISQCFTEEYKAREDIKMDIDMRNHDEFNDEGISYGEKIVDNKNYRIDLDVYDAKDESYIKIDFLGQNPSDYFNKSGLEYTSYSIYDDDMTMSVYRADEYSKDKTMDAEVSIKVEKLGSEKFQEVFATACAKVGINEKDVNSMYEKIKAGEGETGYSFVAFQEVTKITDEQSDILVYYTQEERESEKYITVYLENKQVEIDVEG